MTYTIEAHFAASGAQVMSLLFGEEVDLVFMGLTPFVVAKSFGIPIRLLATSKMLTETHCTVLGKKKLAPSELHYVATAQGSTGHQLGYAWAKHTNTKVRFVNMQPRHQVKALKKMRVDGLATWRPFVGDAVEIGAEIACTAHDLNVPLFNTIAVTEHALANKHDILRAFMEGYAEAVVTVEQEHELNTPDWPMEVFWTSPPSTHPIHRGIAESIAFAEGAELTGKYAVSEETLFILPSNRKTKPLRTPTELAVGYTDSTMCQPFHVGRSGGHYARKGFVFPPESLRREERLLGLSEKNQEKFETLIKLTKTDRLSVPSSARVYLEHLLRETHLEYYGREGAKSLEKLIIDVYKTGGMPQWVYSAAHYLRTHGNEVLHSRTSQPELTTAKLESILEQALIVMEWEDGPGGEWLKAKKACTKCGEELRREWDYCPKCGKFLGKNCPNCNEAVGLDWPKCGKCQTPLVGIHQQPAS